MKTIPFIRLTNKSCHYLFGNETTKTFDYEIADGEKAYDKYKTLKSEADKSNGYCAVFIDIIWK